MTIKASGRSALILATALWAGFLICLAGPSQAAADDAAAGSASTSAAAPISLNKTALGKDTKHTTHHLKKLAHRKSGKLAQKLSTDSQPAADATAANTTPGDTGNSPPATSATLPASIANAKAEMTPADATGGNAQAMSMRASNILQTASNNTADMPAATGTRPAETQIVSADQLNDVDRALHEDDSNDQRQVTLAMASAEPTATAANNDNNSWDETSLIGKIFMGFGALLIVASAARMFMA